MRNCEILLSLAVIRWRAMPTWTPATTQLKWRRALWLLRACRSCSVSPPQTPASRPDSIAHFRQVSTTSQRRQTTFALFIWCSAGRLFPLGKNKSGGSSRQAARLRQVNGNRVLELCPQESNASTSLQASYRSISSGWAGASEIVRWLTICGSAISLIETDAAGWIQAVPENQPRRGRVLRCCRADSCTPRYLEHSDQEATQAA